MIRRAATLVPSRVASLVAILAVVVAAAGCNTIAGVGKDLEKAGETIQRKAK